MRVVKVPIMSARDPAKGGPWYKLAPTATPMKWKLKEAKEAQLKGRAINLAVSTAKPTEMHVLAVTLDRQIKFLPASELPPVCWAFLAFYTPGTDTLRVLDFQEYQPTQGV